MSLNKAIEHGKEHRKAYRGAKAVSASCRNHGACEYCTGNRIHKKIEQDRLAKEEIRKYI